MLLMSPTQLQLTVAERKKKEKIMFTGAFGPANLENILRTRIVSLICTVISPLNTISSSYSTYSKSAVGKTLQSYILENDNKQAAFTSVHLKFWTMFEQTSNNCTTVKLCNCSLEMSVQQLVSAGCITDQ